jgi:signal transduction histidine kinase
MCDPQAARRQWTAALRRARRNLLLRKTLVSKVLGHAVAAALVGCGLALQIGVYERLRPAPFLLLFPAVYLAAWLGGRGPGWFAVVLAALLGNYVFIEPRFEWVGSGSGVITTVLFGAVAGGFVELTSRLRDAENRAQQLARSREEFIAAAAHELKTPLSALQLQLELLLRPVRASGDLKAIERGKKVAASAKRVERLFDLLLDTSRIQAGRLQLERTDIDLAALARDVLDSMSNDGSVGGCPVSLEIEGDPRGRWDPLRIEQVVRNLVSNACKYGGGNPVSVKLRGEDGAAVLSVEDRGVGISSDALPRLFQPFERGDAGLTRVGGTGLGLWIVRQIVEAHGGRVEAQSEPGRGSRFRVTLPVA